MSRFSGTIGEKFFNIDIAIFKRLFVYFLIFVLSLLVFIPLRFPAEVFSQLVIKELNKSIYPYSITAGYTDHTSIGRYKFSSVVISTKEKEGRSVLMELNSIDIDISILSAILKKIYSDVRLKLLGGSGLVSISSDSFDIQSVMLDLDFDNIDIKELVRSFDIPYISPEGMLNAKGKINILNTDISQSSGEIRLEVRSGLLKSSKELSSIINISSVNINDTKCNFVIKDGLVNIERCKFSGSDLDLNIAGTVLLKQDLKKSRLDISITGFLKGELNKTLMPILSIATQSPIASDLRINIRGTIESPRLI